MDRAASRRAMVDAHVNQQGVTDHDGVARGDGKSWLMKKSRREPPFEVETRFPSTLQQLAAIQTAASDPHRLVDVLGAATDRADAIERLITAFKFPAEEAAVVLDIQFAAVIASRKEELSALIEREREAPQSEERIGMVSE